MPLAVQNGVHNLIGPLPLDEFILDVVCLATEPQSLCECGRPVIASIEASRDAVSPQHVKTQVDGDVRGARG
jgi:hypothetical protein